MRETLFTARFKLKKIKMHIRSYLKCYIEKGCKPNKKILLLYKGEFKNSYERKV